MMLLCLDLQFLPAAWKYVKPFETDGFQAGIPLATLKLLWSYCIAGLYKSVAPVGRVFLVPLKALLRGNIQPQSLEHLCLFVFSHTSYRIVDVDILVADAEFFRNVLSQGLHTISLGGVMPG
ncbi:hypothetical protein SAMN05216417_103242 [Nitrosospira multiformis]|uniref:Uncharacterized protein n=1 Tax=Nitrosospira multiformis TaxID=1231 RepID=A0A1I7G6K8_9PROT|nr:hypothetical protein SAMN05216417_103242 [Nitrosospira multiformis]